MAKHLKDHAGQDALFRILDRRHEEGKQWNQHQIETAAKKMAKAGKVTKTESNLFGDFEDEQSTFDQEVELESHINRALNKTFNDFSSVSNAGRAERVKAAGNSLAVEENAKRRDKAAEHLEDFERESGRTGEVADAIKAGAAALAVAKGKERDAIKDRTLETVRAILERGTGIRTPKQPAPVDAGGGSEGGSGAPQVDGAAKPAEQVAKPEPSMAGTDLLGRPIKKPITAPKGFQPDMNDMLREMKYTKAKEFADEKGGKIDEWRGAQTFRIGPQWYHVGTEEEGYPVYESDAEGVRTAPKGAENPQADLKAKAVADAVSKMKAAAPHSNASQLEWEAGNHWFNDSAVSKLFKTPDEFRAAVKAFLAASAAG